MTQASRRVALSLCVAVALGACATTTARRALLVTTSDSARACDATPPALATAQATDPREALLAAVTDAEPRELVLYDLVAQQVRWRRPVAAQARPELLADLVVTSADGFVLGFDTHTGAQRMRLPSPLPVLIGAAQRGSRVFIVTSSAPSRDVAADSTLTAFDLERGSVAWTRELHDVAGRPQLSADRVLTLLAHRDLQVFDGASGHDVSCTRLGASDGGAGHATDWLRVTESGVFFGDTHARSLADPAATALELPLAVRPAPAFFEPDDAPVPGTRSARGRVALIAELGAAQTAHAAPQLRRFFFVFYRALFAYRGDGTLLWARVLDADVARASSNGAQLLVALETGVVQRFAVETGAQSLLGTLAARIASADLSNDAARETTAGGAASPAPALQRVLASLAIDTDSRLLPARELAVDALATSVEPSATCDLLAVYTARAVPDTLRERVAERLRARSLGTQCLIDRLGQHADFLEGTAPPPLAAIVPALVAQHETRATSQLIEQLFDPQTPATALAPLIDAIDALGGADGRVALARFRALYHADSVLAGDAATLALLARALDGPHEPTPRPAALTQGAAPSALPAAAPPGAPRLPDAPDENGVRAVMAQHAGELQACVQEELGRNAELRNVRLGFVVVRDGSAHALQVLPSSAELDRCVRAKLYTYRFPLSHDGSRPLSYLLAARARVQAPVPGPSDARRAAPDQPAFWALSQARAAKPAASADAAPTSEPWWVNQNPLFLSVEPPPAATPSVAPSPSAATTATPAADAWWVPAPPAQKKP